VTEQPDEAVLPEQDTDLNDFDPDALDGDDITDDDEHHPAGPDE
jgi:hypothetical protein